MGYLDKYRTADNGKFIIGSPTTFLDFAVFKLAILILILT